MDDGLRTPHDDGRGTKAGHNSSPWALRAQVSFKKNGKRRDVTLNQFTGQNVTEAVLISIF